MLCSEVIGIQWNTIVGITMLERLSTSAAEFAARRYVVQHGLLNTPSLEFYYRYALAQAGSGTMDLDDGMVPGTPGAYGDPTMEMLLEKLCPTVEGTTGLSLFPTYS